MATIPPYVTHFPGFDVFTPTVLGSAPFLVMGGHCVPRRVGDDHPVRSLEMDAGSTSGRNGRSLLTR